MSDLETLKAQHPISKVFDAIPISDMDEIDAYVFALASKLQQHEAELAKAQETIQQQARELEEADKALIEMWELNWWERHGDKQAYDAAVARHSARAQQAEAKKEGHHG